MMLSKTAERALRITAFLALTPNALRFRARELAAATNIPLRSTSRILHRLVAATLLRSAKGRGGGFELARPPSSVRFIDVFEAMEGELELERCVFGWKARHRSPRFLGHRLGELNRAFQAWARRTTLADVKKDVSTLGSLSLFSQVAALD